MGNLLRRWMNTPTRGELRTAKMVDLKRKAKCYDSAYAAGYVDGYAAANRKAEIIRREEEK